MFLYYSDSQLTKKTHNMPPSICRRGDIWGYFCVHFGICSYFVRNIQSFHIKLCKSCWHYSDDHYTKKIECMSYSARGNTGGYFRTILGIIYLWLENQSIFPCQIFLIIWQLPHLKPFNIFSRTFVQIVRLDITLTHMKRKKTMVFGFF